MSIKLLEKITRNIFIQNALNTSIFNVKKKLILNTIQTIKP